MPVNLPSSFGLSHSGGTSMRPQASAHAQNFSTSRLNQHKERAKASTSMGRAMQRGNSGPTSSIGRVLNGNIGGHDEEYGMFSEEERDEIRTRLRYQNIRKMMKEKKAATISAERASKQHNGIHIKTGGTYSKGGWGGTKKTLKKVFKKGKYSKYKNLSASDKKHLEQIVEEGGAHGFKGGGYGYSTKKAMGAKAWKKYKSGDISKEDYKDFKGVIRDLD